MALSAWQIVVLAISSLLVGCASVENENSAIEEPPVEQLDQASVEVLPENRPVVRVHDDQSVLVYGIPGCYNARDLFVELPSDDWTFEVGLQDLGSALGIGTWKYGDGEIDLYSPGRVTGQLDGLEFSAFPDDKERNFYSYATARADDGSLVLVKDVALEEIPDDGSPYCPPELRLRNLSSEQEEELLNGLRMSSDM